MWAWIFFLHSFIFGFGARLLKCFWRYHTLGNLRNYNQFYHKRSHNTSFKAKNYSTNFTVTIKDYKTLVCKAITFVVSMAPLMLKMLDPDQPNHAIPLELEDNSHNTENIGSVRQNK